MKLWVLHAKIPVGYDSYDGFVVRATTEKDARGMAQASGADETHKWERDESISRTRNIDIPFWTSEEYSSCQELMPEGDPGILVSSFNAG